MIHQLEDVNDFEESTSRVPSILCEATGWQPEKLRKLEDFFYAVDKTKPDHFEEAKSRGLCRPDLTSVDEMNEKERARFDETVDGFKETTYISGDDIKRIILRDLVYRKMQFVNAELLALLDSGESDSEDN